MQQRAAHFLRSHELVNSPPNEALVTALLELGLQVDIYAPGNWLDVSAYGSGVRGFTVGYGYRWLAKNLLNRRWYQYRLISGTAEDPLAIAGIISRFYRIPCVTLADEIKSGSHSGNRSSRWKSLCRLGMRGSALTIVNGVVRISLQKDYVGLPVDSPVVVFPGAFRETPPAVNRTEWRDAKSIPADTLLMAYSGVFGLGNGGLWMSSLLRARSDVHILGQIVGTDELVTSLLKSVKGAERLHFEPARLDWREAWSQASIADIGMVVYLQDGPQFQNMGISSNRLCMFLAMGVPVIASRQPSFEFIEEYDCGILVDNQIEFIQAIDKIQDRLVSMKANAFRCAREYINAPGKYQTLRESLAQLVGK